MEEEATDFLKSKSDLELMVDLARDLCMGAGENDAFVLRLRELKSRDLIWQSKIGRALPTQKGRDLWAHATSIIAGEVLYGRCAEARRPCFVVFDAEDKPLAFRCWDDAVAFARWLKDSSPDAFGTVGNAEDLVETWERANLSSDEADRLEREGSVAIPNDSPGVVG